MRINLAAINFGSHLYINMPAQLGGMEDKNMRIRLINHDYKYAIEQILLTIFPEERPEYLQDSLLEISIKEMPDNFVLSSLTIENGYGSVLTRIKHNDRFSEAIEETSAPLSGDKLLRDRELQKTVKLSFYKAAVHITGKNPPWGALTGIRPAKLATRHIAENNASFEDAAKYLENEYYVSSGRAKLCADAARSTMKIIDFLRPEDISLYIGIPFCPTRCAYCSFVSHSVEKSFKLVEPYLKALYREIEETGKIIADLGKKVISVYIGGGTPTTLSAAMLSELMGVIRSNIELSSCLEYTVEAGRPDTITEDRLLALKEGGTTRISINPQSMENSVLDAIGRSHRGEDIVSSFELARSLGFNIINMDLIAGLPSDTHQGFIKSLDAVMRLGPENITIHTLSIKRGSRLNEEGALIPDGEEVGKMLDYSVSALRNGGYAPYYLYRQKYTSGSFENTGWSKAETEGIYNVCIMEELHSIISLGAGGVTKLVKPSSGRIERIFNKKYPLEYINDIDNLITAKNYISKFENEN